MSRFLVKNWRELWFTWTSFYQHSMPYSTKHGTWLDTTKGQFWQCLLSCQSITLSPATRCTKQPLHDSIMLHNSFAYNPFDDSCGTYTVVYIFIYLIICLFICMNNDEEARFAVTPSFVLTHQTVLNTVWWVRNSEYCSSWFVTWAVWSINRCVVQDVC